MRNSQFLSGAEWDFSLEPAGFSEQFVPRKSFLLRDLSGKKLLLGATWRICVELCAAGFAAVNERVQLRGDLRALLYCICPAANRVALSSRG